MIAKLLYTYLFTGRRWDFLDDGDLKIQLNRNRYYNSYTGRWLTKDPLGIDPADGFRNPFGPKWQYSDTMSLYEYVNSRPVMGRDPEGFRGGGGGGHSMPCDIIRHTVEIIENLPPGSGPYFDSIRKLYYIISRGIIYPNASRMLRYWLSGGREDQRISKSFILSDNGGRTAYQSLKNTVKSNVRCACEGITGTFSEPVSPSGGDLFYTTGPFELQAYGTYKATFFCRKCKRKVRIYVSMTDPYNWHPGLATSVCGVAIPDKWAVELQQHDNLHTFNIYAEWNESLGCVPCK